MILMLNQQTVLNDALEVLGFKVAARLAVSPGTIRAKWGNVNGNLAPMFTVVTEHGRIPAEDVYGKCKDLYAEMGILLANVLKGIGDTRGEVQEEAKLPWLQ